MNTKNDRIGITFLFDDKNDLCVPLRGELKLKFKNEKKYAQKFTATVQSLRFDIVEANYGQYPTRQFATDLAPGEETELTIIDRGTQGDPPKLEWFYEGWIRFGAGTEWRCSIYPTWAQKSLGLPIITEDCFDPYPVYLIAVKGGRSLGIDKCLNLVNATSSYKELKEVFRKKNEAKMKEEDNSDKYERMEEGLGRYEELMEMEDAMRSTMPPIRKWTEKDDRINIKLLFDDKKDVCVPARGELKLKFRNEKKYAQKFTATIQSLRFDIVEANYGQYPTRQFAKELAPGEHGSITIIDRGPKPVEHIRIENEWFREGRIRFGAGISWKFSFSPSWDGPLCWQPRNYRKAKVKPRYYMLAWKDDEFPETDCCLVMENETPSYKEMKKKVEDDVDKLMEQNSKAAEERKANREETRSARQETTETDYETHVSKIYKNKKPTQETGIPKKICAEIPTKTTEPKPKPSPTVVVNQMPKKKKKCCIIL